MNAANVRVLTAASDRAAGISGGGPPDASRSARALRQNLTYHCAAAWRNHRAGFHFTGASTLLSVVTMLASILLVRWISPDDLGLWQSTRLAVTYAFFLLAGVNNGLSRELPYFLGRGDIRRAERLAGTSASCVLLACIVALLGGAFALNLYRDASEKVLWSIAAVDLVIVFTFYTNYLIVTYRSARSFNVFARIKIFETVCTAASLLLIFYYGYHGLLGRAVLLAGAVLLLMHLTRPMRVSLCWNRTDLGLLLKTGLPIFALDYVVSTAGTCDRLMLLKFDGLRGVGLYALPLLARSAMTMVQDAATEYIYPRMSHSFGAHHDPLRLWNMAVKSALLTFALMIPAAVCGWFALPALVTRLFPKYIEAVGPARLLLLASLFSGVIIGKMVLLSMKDVRAMTWYQILCAIFVVAGPLIGGYVSDVPLYGVAMGTLVTQALWLPVGGFIIYLSTHRDAFISPQQPA